MCTLWADEVDGTGRPWPHRDISGRTQASLALGILLRSEPVRPILLRALRTIGGLRGPPLTPAAA